MKRTLKDKISDKLVNAFLKNKIVSPIPSKFTKKRSSSIGGWGFNRDVREAKGKYQK